jgi:hypothetical protein
VDPHAEPLRVEHTDAMATWADFETEAPELAQAAVRRWPGIVALDSNHPLPEALFGALATADAARRALWAFVAASVAALATALTSYEAAFGFERLARQYAQTRSAIALTDVFGPRPEDLDQLATDEERDESVSTFVANTERLLRSEVDTWSYQATTQPEPWPRDGTV